MTKKQFNSICSLYHQGASMQVCTNLILDFCKKKNSDPASWIVKFFEEQILYGWKDEYYIMKKQYEDAKKALGIEEVRVADLMKGKDTENPFCTCGRKMFCSCSVCDNDK